MHRRHFVKLTGASLGSLLATQWLHAKGESVQLIQIPDKIEVRIAEGWVSLQSPGREVWQYRDIAVTVKLLPDRVSVYLQSPSELIKAVKLSWKYAYSKTDKFLGDHWERTYGDVLWQPAELVKKLPWYLIQHDGHNVNCFAVKTGASAICYWQLDANELQLVLDTRTGGNGVKLGNRTLHAADIVTTISRKNENVFAAVRRFCKQVCDTRQLPAQPVYGINDWYFAYGNNSAQLILTHTGLMADLATDTGNRPFSVIDAGWALKSPAAPNDCCWGDDFAVSNSKFGDMSKLAGQIKAMGMRPGLWTRPLCAKHNDNPNLLTPLIPGRNDPKFPILDPTIEENVQRIRNYMKTYRSWGYELVKHDFTTFDIFGKWGFEMQDDLTVPGWQFNDNTKTNAEIILHLYKSIREAAGSMYLIGCNTVSHLSAGLFELNRVGDDTSGNEWERTRKMGVNTLGFRMVQHRIFYEADGDCVGLTTKVPWSKNKQWMQLLAESSTPLFISAQPEALGAEQKAFIKQSFSAAAKDQPVAEPLDWLTNPLPSEWKLNGKMVKFDWT